MAKAETTRHGDKLQGAKETEPRIVGMRSHELNLTLPFRVNYTYVVMACLQ